MSAEEINIEKQPWLSIEKSTDIDVLNESLYSFDNAVFLLTPAMRERASLGLWSIVEQFINSSPALLKATEGAVEKTEYTPLIPTTIKKLLAAGKVEFIPRKNNSDAFFLQVRSKVKGLVIDGKKYGLNRKIKDIPLREKVITADITSAMQCLSMQAQLNQIAEGLKEISEACEFNFSRILQGQHDDRIAKLISSRSCYVQALAVMDENLRRQMLIRAVCDANSARAELAFEIRSGIMSLSSGKTPKAKDMEKIVADIDSAVIAMSSAVQLLLYSYQVLGEHTAQLAAVKEYWNAPRRLYQLQS